MGILGKIWLVPAQGGEARQLTSGYGWDHHPVWSPDGRHIAYVHDTPSASSIVLHTISSGASRTLYGRSPDVVASGSRGWGAVYSIGHMAFHPTDERLYFVDFRTGIKSVSVHGPNRAPELVLNGSGRIGRPGITDRSSFAFSPDGSRVAVEKDTTNLWTHLHVAPFASDAFTQVTTADTVKYTEVTWTPDGSALVYLEQSGGIESVVVHPLAGARTPTKVELGPFNGRELALYPDGNRALVVSDRQLFNVDLATGATTPLPFAADFLLPPEPVDDLVITNARLFDATGADVIESATVQIRDGIISAVTSGRYEGDADVRVINAEGKFLMPGLTEAHNHLWQGANLTLSALATRGVTTVFDAGSYLPETLNLRDAMAMGLVTGPRIYTAGPTIDGPAGRPRPLTVSNVAEPETGRAVVRALARTGVDAIKIYAFLEPAVVTAVVEEAHANGLPVMGDFVTTPWSAALDAGVDGLIHIMDHKWRFISDAQPDPSEGPWGVVEPDSVVVDRFFGRVASSDVMFDPTVMASARQYSADEFAQALAAPPGEDLNYTHVVRDIMRSMHRNGVQWVAGTDIGASRLVDELEVYEMLGIPNSTVLQTATSNVARWLRKDDFGTVEPGKRADLLLVDGDPLQRIRDLDNIALVVQGGVIVVER